jgi:hypothetical protein
VGAVRQFPGPEGVRPGLLAERAGMGKQAMNQLLRNLEGLGYLTRGYLWMFRNETVRALVLFVKGMYTCSVSIKVASKL